MKTSHSVLERLLDPDNPSVTLLTLERAARALGKSIRIEIAAKNKWFGSPETMRRFIMSLPIPISGVSRCSGNFSRNHFKNFW